jgi:hypothetical protein
MPWLLQWEEEPGKLDELLALSCDRVAARLRSVSTIGSPQAKPCVEVSAMPRTVSELNAYDFDDGFLSSPVSSRLSSGGISTWEARVDHAATDGGHRTFVGRGRRHLIQPSLISGRGFAQGRRTCTEQDAANLWLTRRLRQQVVCTHIQRSGPKASIRMRVGYDHP